ALRVAGVVAREDLEDHVTLAVAVHLGDAEADVIRVVLADKALVGAGLLEVVGDLRPLVDEIELPGLEQERRRLLVAGRVGSDRKQGQARDGRVTNQSQHGSVFLLRGRHSGSLLGKASSLRSRLPAISPFMKLRQGGVPETAAAECFRGAEPRQSRRNRPKSREPSATG